MRALRRMMKRATAVVRSNAAADADLRAEMEAHLAMATDENVRRGMDPAEARRQAILASGGLTQAAELVREQRRLPWLESIAADVRYAIRHFRRTPLTTATMVAVLSLGLGTNVVLFTVVNSILTMPAPGIERDASLVRIRGSIESMSGSRPRMLSWPEVQSYATRTDLFSGVAAYADETGVVSLGDDDSETATAGLIYTTRDYFDILSIRPALGTAPVADADVTRMSASPAVMISHAMWKQRFGGATDVIGRTIRVNDFPVQIAAVAPERFLGTEGGTALTMWIPLNAYPLLQKRTTAAFTSADSMFLSAAARLRPGVAIESAMPVVAGLARRGFDADSGSADVAPLLAENSAISGDRSDEIISAAASGGLALLALLITCTNVSALMVGLAVARRKEIAVRLSLGAPRRRLIRQLLTESILLATVSAALCLVLTAIGIDAIGGILEDVQLVVDWRVTILTCSVALVTGVLFGLSPALHATRVSVNDVLRSSAASVATTRSRLQRSLVVAQVALTQPLLVGLGVVIVTMMAGLESRTPAGASASIAEIELDTWSGRVSNDERAALVDAAVQRIAAMPGVTHAMPLSLGTDIVALTVHPDDRVPGINYQPSIQALLKPAPDGYFESFGIPIVRGRDFSGSEYVRTSNDASRPTTVARVIIAGDLARQLWGGADPIGRRLTHASSLRNVSPDMVVVGVVDEAAAGKSVTGEQVRIYVPFSPMSDGVIARTAGPALPLLNGMRRAVASAAPQMPILRVQTMEQREAEARRSVVNTGRAIAGGGLLALILSAIGLYAVVSFGVQQRTQEIGVRTALGAQRSEVVRMFFLRGLVLCAIGLVLGLPLSILGTRVIAASVPWPLASSPLIGLAIGGVVLLVASIAVWIPARRASTIDPIIALRSE